MVWLSPGQSVRSLSLHRIGRTWLSPPVPPRRTSARVRNDGVGWWPTLVMVTSVTSLSPSWRVEAGTPPDEGAPGRRPVTAAEAPGVDTGPVARAVGVVPATA